MAYSMRRSAATTLIAAVIVAAASVAVAAQPKTDPFEAAVRRLRDAVTAHRDGRHVDLLASLRSTQDPSLSPLFSRLTSSNDPLIQINGILGLAEVSPERRIDPWLISRLPSEAAKLQAINLAVGLELVDAQQMRAMLAWEKVEDTLAAALCAELISRGEAVEATTVERLAKSENQKVRALASMLLVQVTGERAPFETTLGELRELPSSEQHNAFMWLANDAGQYRLDRMLWWLEELARDDDAEDSLTMLAVESALLIEPEQGAAMWQSNLARDPSHARRVTHGLLLLDAAREAAIPAELFEFVRDGDDLTERIADAGAAFAASRESAAEPLIALLSLDHWRSAADAAAAAEFLPPDQAIQVYRAIIVRGLDASADASVRPGRQELAIRSVPLLFKLDPQAVGDFLAEAVDDSREQELILIGLLGVHASLVGDVAGSVRRLGYGASDSLALLLVARHAQPGDLSEADLAALAMLAAGGGRLSPSLNVEAAWLYIKHTGKIELAMSQLFTSEQG